MFAHLLALHKWSAIIFTVFISIKYIMLLTDKDGLFNSVHQKTKLVNMLLSVIVLGAGIYVATAMGWGNLAGWMHLKFTLIVLGIPITIIGFNKTNKWISGIGVLMFIYIVLLALQKHLGLGL